jgi:glycosyltransferase involved in cell wall biosynthesis
MKVLLVSGIYPPDIGGPATFIPGFEEYLREQGNKVKVLTLSDDPRRSRFLYPGVSFTSRKLIFGARQLVTIIKLMGAAFNSDIIFSNGLIEESAFATLLLRKKTNFKIVGDPIWERFRNETGSIISIEEFNQSDIPIRYRIQRSILRISLNQSKAICTPSDQLKLFIKQWGVHRPITVIPNGVPIIRIPEPEKLEFDVVTVSRLVKWKNIDKIIDACKTRNLKLAIIGDGPEFAALKSKCLGSEDQIVFLGELYGEKLNSAIASAKIFTLFSEYEGLSFALISAMMLGRYIVASDIPGNRNAVVSGVDGILVPLDNFTNYCDALEQGTFDNLSVSTIRKKARENAVERFSDIKSFEKSRELMKI